MATPGSVEQQKTQHKPVISVPLMSLDVQSEGLPNFEALSAICEGDEEFDPERQQPTFTQRSLGRGHPRAGSSPDDSGQRGFNDMSDQFDEEPESFKPWVPAGANVEKQAGYSYFPDWFTIWKADRKHTAKVALHWERLYQDALLRLERKQEVAQHLKSHCRTQDVSFRVEFDDEALKERFSCLYEDAFHRWGRMEDRERAAVLKTKQLDVSGTVSEQLAQLPPEEREAKIMESVERMYSARVSLSPRLKEAKEGASQPKARAKRRVNEQRINDLYLHHFNRVKEHERRQQEQSKKEEEKQEAMEREMKERSLVRRRALRARLGEEPDGKPDFEALSKRPERKPADDMPGVQNQARRPAKEVDEIFKNLFQQMEHRREMMNNLRSEKLIMDEEALLHPPSQLTKEEIEEIRNRLYKPRRDFAQKDEDEERDQPPSAPPRAVSPDWHERMYAVAKKQNDKIEQQRKNKAAKEAEALREMQFSASRSKQRLLREEAFARLTKQSKAKVSRKVSQRREVIVKYKAPPAITPDFVNRLHRHKPRGRIRESDRIREDVKKTENPKMERATLSCSPRSPRSPRSTSSPVMKETDAMIRLQREAQSFFASFAPPSRVGQANGPARKVSDQSASQGSTDSPQASPRGQALSQLEMKAGSPKLSRKNRLEPLLDPRTAGLSQRSVRRVLRSKVGFCSPRIRVTAASTKARKALQKKAAGYNKLDASEIIRMELEKYIERPKGKEPSPRCHLRDMSPPNVPQPYYKRQQAVLFEKNRQQLHKKHEGAGGHSRPIPKHGKHSATQAQKHFDIHGKLQPALVDHSSGNPKRQSGEGITETLKSAASANVVDSTTPLSIPVSRQTMHSIQSNDGVSRETSRVSRRSDQAARETVRRSTRFSRQQGSRFDTAEVHKKLSVHKKRVEPRENVSIHSEEGTPQTPFADFARWSDYDV